AFADARDVAFGNANHLANELGRQSDALTGATGSGAARRHVRIGPAIQIQEGALRTFEEYGFAGGSEVANSRFGIDDKRSERRRGVGEFVPVVRMLVAMSAKFSVGLSHRREPSAAPLVVDELTQAQTVACRLCCVSRSNATFGRPYGRLGF